MTKRENAPLRDQIIAFLKSCDEATLKQIAAATTERDFPSRVTTELNKMRTDALVECAKKNGKNEMWYWLATSQDDQSGTSLSAVTKTPGSSASANPLVSQTAEPVAEDEIPEADPRLQALANRELADRLARVAHVLRGSGLEGLKDLDDGADLQTAAAALTGAYQMALAELHACTGKIADLQHKINMQDAELVKQADVVVDLRNQLGEERTARQALQEQLEELQREATRGASLLSGGDRYTAAGYLVRAPKRPFRTFSKAEAAQAAALAAARNGSGRGEVFALVPVGKAVRGAEWRAA